MLNLPKTWLRKAKINANYLKLQKNQRNVNLADLLENHNKKSHKTKKTDIILRVDYVKGVHPKVQESSKTLINHGLISTECENIKIEPDIDLDLFDVDMKGDFM